MVEKFGLKLYSHCSKELNLSGNAFCEVGGEWLGQAIASNEAIKRLNLSWNHLRRKVKLGFNSTPNIETTVMFIGAAFDT